MATTTQLFPLPRVIFTTSTYGNENDALKAPESLYLISQDRMELVLFTWSITLVFLFFDSSVFTNFFDTQPRATKCEGKMKRFSKLALAVAAVVSFLCFLVYKTRYDRLYSVLEVLEFFGQDKIPSNIR